MNKNHLSEQNPYREELENLHQNIERARHAHRNGGTLSKDGTNAKSKPYRLN